MKRYKRTLCAILAALCLVLTAATALAATDGEVYDAAFDAAECLREKVKSPQVGAVGGEWTVLGLARGGFTVPEEYFQTYLANVEEYVRACGGVLHERKYTEYSRVIIALTALGVDARDVAGYDLTLPLGDYEKTIRQGVNGPIWALLALDSGGYPMPVNTGAKIRATRQMYVDRILKLELSEGGWSLSGTSADPDITGMALQALAKYTDEADVAAAVDRALSRMSGLQDSSGGYSYMGGKCCESAAQMTVALTELGIPLDDARFVKNGRTLTDALLGYYRKGRGFAHDADSEGLDLMATEQGLYALAAVIRASEGKNSLYRMEDAEKIAPGAAGGGLSGKHRDVKAVPISHPGKTFPDISGDNAAGCQAQVEALAARGIVDGADGLFRPERTMTRAEFAAIIVRGLGLEPRATGNFPDVQAGEWYAPYVGTASTYGIINGVGGGKFDPLGTVTRQEAAVMAARAAGLCGMDTSVSAAGVRDVLSQFSDYVKCGQWARESLAFCYEAGILDGSALKIEPAAAVTRGEMALIVYNLLAGARLI